jgi:UDP-glucuronate 4-epimerase
MRYLVTGGAGFIGSHLVYSLLRDEHDVVAVDCFDDFYDPAVKRRNLQPVMASPKFRLDVTDIRDVTALQRIFSSNKFDAVIHLAARVGIHSSTDKPELYYDVNVNGTLKLLEVMRLFGCKKLIFASSSSVYGNTEIFPFEETAKVDCPISQYAASKISGELLCHTYHVLYGFDVFCLRFFSVYGPRQRPEMAIHRFFSNIINGIPLKIYGDGSIKRDYTFIDDIIYGIRASIERVNNYEIINLGGATSISLLELIKLIEKIVEKPSQIIKMPVRPEDVKSTLASIKKAEKCLQYNPRTMIENGLKLFYQWMQAGKSDEIDLA